MTLTSRAVVALGLFLGLTAESLTASIGDRDLDIRRRPNPRHRLIEQMRIAASARLIEHEDAIAAYRRARFNTIALYDTDDGGLLKSERRIAYEVTFARALRLRILLGKATEPSSSHLIGEGRGRMIPTVDAAAAAVSDEEIKERLRLWARYGHDLIVGVFFLHDDAFLIHTTVERQRHLYKLAHETVPEWYVFGMIGEFGFRASPEQMTRYFDPRAFDHLIVLMYPFNLGPVIGVRLDNIQSADPDADVRRYVERYLTTMAEKFLRRLRRDQLILLVIQAFAYHGEPAGHVPRAADIEIQATVGSELLRNLTGQTRNRAVAYFLWDGAGSGMFGLWQRADWRESAEGTNRFLEGTLPQLAP